LAFLGYATAGAPCTTQTAKNNVNTKIHKMIGEKTGHLRNTYKILHSALQKPKKDDFNGT
jgi:hypothetical protein